MPDDFDWDDVETVCYLQRRSAVYLNPHGQVVIRQEQESFYHEEDPFVFFNVENVPALIEKLRQFVPCNEKERGQLFPNNPAIDEAQPTSFAAPPISSACAEKVLEEIWLAPFLAFMIEMYFRLGCKSEIAKLTKAQITYEIVRAWPEDLLGPIKGGTRADKKAPASIEYMATFLRSPEAQNGGLRPWRRIGNGNNCSTSATVIEPDGVESEPSAGSNRLTRTV